MDAPFVGTEKAQRKEVQRTSAICASRTLLRWLSGSSGQLLYITIALKYHRRWRDDARNTRLQFNRPCNATDQFVRTRCTRTELDTQDSHFGA